MEIMETWKKLDIFKAKLFIDGVQILFISNIFMHQQAWQYFLLIKTAEKSTLIQTEFYVKIGFLNLVCAKYRYMSKDSMYTNHRFKKLSHV